MELFSLILIIKNDAHHLDLCLRSVSQLNYPREYFEVIIIDDGSAIPLNREVSIDPEYCYHYISETADSCRSRARNLGASFARYDLLIFVDGDQALTPDLLLTYDIHINKNPNAQIIFGSRIYLSLWQQNKCKESLKNNNLAATFLPLLKNSQDPKVMLLDYLKKSFHEVLDHWSLFLSCNFFIYKKTFNAIGGFDEDFKDWGFEDNEFAYRLYKNNIRMDLIDNRVLDFPQTKPLTEEKYYCWVKNFNIFLKKHNDVKILMYFTFENMLFSTLKDKPTGNWFELYKNFYEKIEHFDKIKNPLE